MNFLKIFEQLLTPDNTYDPVYSNSNVHKVLCNPKKLLHNLWGVGNIAKKVQITVHLDIYIRQCANELPTIEIGVLIAMAIEYTKYNKETLRPVNPIFALMMIW